MFLLPHQIDQIMDTAFTSEGLIRLNTLEETDFEKIPIMRQVECLCQHILNENGRLKLTPNGNLPAESGTGDVRGGNQGLLLRETSL